MRAVLSGRYAVRGNGPGRHQQFRDRQGSDGGRGLSGGTRASPVLAQRCFLHHDHTLDAIQDSRLTRSANYYQLEIPWSISNTRLKRTGSEISTATEKNGIRNLNCN